MSAYIVFQRVITTNKASLAQYSQEVGDSFKETLVDFLVAYGKQETLEGAPTEGTVILKFGSMAAAKGWYYSDAYQKAAQHRFLGAQYNATLVEGTDTE
ncbi:MAG: DUF1330 domain-containing protein [Advenella sp.]|uniref:DUF1330 domain-containing protein n=1 Tax=Advenella sp. TaxID=1872388 RepID=UPI003F95A0BA